MVLMNASRSVRVIFIHLQLQHFGCYRLLEGLHITLLCLSAQHGFCSELHNILIRGPFLVTILHLMPSSCHMFQQFSADGLPCLRKSCLFALNSRLLVRVFSQSRLTITINGQITDQWSEAAHGYSEQINAKSSSSLYL